MIVMGKKAKLKQLRREAKEKNSEVEPKPLQNFAQTQFVEQLKQQGYNLKQIQQSPEIPNSDRGNPQL